MPIIRNFDEARANLRQFYHRPGSNTYTLDRMWALMRHLGDPQDRLRVVHVAGTSGKTSTAYYVAALLEASGAQVGLTVSPHLVEMNERVQINHTPLAEADFCRSLGEFIDIVLASHIDPSYFELMVAFAYHEFAKRGVDYAVVEVGLGGLIDGTNVVRRADKVCVITDIGYDHTNVLGKTLPEIATQKAGIIQPGNQVFMYVQAPEIMAVVRARAEAQRAQLYEVGPPESMQIGASLPLFQQRNFYLAEQAANYVLQRDGRPKLTHEQRAKAAAVHVPGRMEIFRIGDKTLVLDGAHNGQKMSALLASMRAKFPDQPVAALVAFVGARDDRWQHALDELLGYAWHIIVTTFNQESDEMPKAGMPSADVADYLASKGVDRNVEPNLPTAYQKLLARPEKLLLVTGSLYMLGDVEKLIAGQ